ncbi:hypothetical protein QUF63_00460 [Anaerolineales bacterium HSG25]|nr:hypothetical protein [Anaerolineales bacterium HSG25]
MTIQGKEIYVGNSNYQHVETIVSGNYVTMLGEDYYCIGNYDRMPPFFMSIISSSNHWLFISSTGGLSAGRSNAESALFPYYTVDKVTENHDQTGPKTILRVNRGERIFLWEPFSDRYTGLYRLTRNLYKNIYGDKLIFEEINHDLQLTYRYAWRTSDRFGFVKTSWLTNQGEASEISLLDGLQNLLPYGASTHLQRTYSNLLNGYKRSELESETGLGIFALSSTLTDLAEPSESLKATTVWQVGFEAPNYLLSANQLDHFRRGSDIIPEQDVRGRRGAYLINANISLPAEGEKVWNIVGEVDQDSNNIASLLNLLRSDKDTLMSMVGQDIEQAGLDLVKIVGRVDGLQSSADQLTTAHHVANTLFNTMRGGIFANHYQISKADFRTFVEIRNSAVLNGHDDFWASLPDSVGVGELLERVTQQNSTDLERLGYEYLPLTFSRRHGDPSRPWNRFSINVKKPDGTQRLDYQGNWRDIFQNWEPLLYAYPTFTESVICKFLNATTADGYNPYRITREGIEWETPDPDDPWANIGYWSDHQIIYLAKLLEVSANFHPGQLETMLNKPIFCHANVPYRIKTYQEILADSYNTIDFEEEKDAQINELVEKMGTDGKLVLDDKGQVFHVTMTEKLLILLLAKLVNLVPEGGIWMNTQRPEWNDANNALVGKGLSVVTVGYLRRFIAFCQTLYGSYETNQVTVTVELNDLFGKIAAIFADYQPQLQGSFDDQQRRAIMTALGQAGTDYRENYYQHGFSGETTSLDKTDLLGFFDVAQQYIEHTLRANKRSDNMYHAYNLLQLGDDTASVGYLYEMLEGQVAVLSAGLLSGEETLALLHSLRHSKLYRTDQHSYILYPDRDLAGFLHKNQITAAQVGDSALVSALVTANDTSLISRDENGVYHFNGTFRNADDVTRVLADLQQQADYAPLIEAERDVMLALFETTFEHDQFTGRSGTFFAFEGLGSIYWHMVSKLLLAVQENYLWAKERGESDEVLSQLWEAYYDVRAGIGFNKTPEVYGAFPTDPYSHSPAEQGAKQPGMTGQVKEELLTRLAELGLFVTQGQLSFNPTLLRQSEFIEQATEFSYVDLNDETQTISLPTNSLAFTFCQVPFVYQNGAERGMILVEYTNGESTEINGQILSADVCQHLFARDGQVRQVTVHLG